jgi:uracil-DNA glycosylase family 4
MVGSFLRSQGIYIEVGNTAIDRFFLHNNQDNPRLEIPKQKPLVSQKGNIESIHINASLPSSIKILNTDEALYVDILKCNTLQELKNLMNTLVDAPLRESATQMVFGEGIETHPDVCVIGEAPGQDEDIQGRPFVGQSGKLLENALSCVGLFRDKNMYITNVIPFRPPANRTPSSDEVLFYLPFLKRRIAILKPKVLLLTGGVCTKALLNLSEGITKIRGQQIDVFVEKDLCIPGMATYHPAFLLRSPLQKRTVWRDLLMLKQMIDPS